MKFNLSKYESIGKLFTSILTYIIFFLTVLMVYHKSIPAPYCLLGIPIILVCYHFIQTYCYQVFFCLLLHVSFLVPIYLLPFSYKEYRYLYFIMVCFETIQAFINRRKNADKSYTNIPWHLFVGICLINIFAFGTDQFGFARIIYYLGIAIIIIHFIRVFFGGLATLLTNTMQTTSIPVKKIILNNTYLFLLFILMFTILTIAIQYSGVEDGLFILAALIFWVFYYIGTIIKSLFSAEGKVEETQKAEQNIEIAVERLSEPTLLSQIIEILFIIIGICLIVYFVYMIIKWLTQTFTKRYSQDTDIIIQIKEPNDKTKEIENRASVVEQVKEFFTGDNVSKIRRSYRLKMKSYKSLIYKECDTPIEVAVRIDEDYNEKIDELTNVYEKARYSNEEITLADVRKARLRS